MLLKCFFLLKNYYDLILIHNIFVLLSFKVMNLCNLRFEFNISSMFIVIIFSNLFFPLNLFSMYYE